MSINYINWDAISSIGTLLTAFIAVAALIINGIQVYMLKKHYDDESRARLVFCIIEWQDILALKVTNIGKTAAFQIHLSLKSKFIENHYSTTIKNDLNGLSSHPLYLMPGCSKYYFLTYEYSHKGATYNIGAGRETFSSNEVNRWLDKYINDPIYVNAKYNTRYCENTELTIKECLGGLVVTDDATCALQKIAKGLVKSNDSILPIQTSLDHISRQVDNGIQIRRKNRIL